MDATARVPDDILNLVLDLLGQPSVLRAAALSRRWRIVAAAHRDFYRFVSLRRPCDIGVKPHGIDAFLDVMSYIGDDAPNLRVDILYETPDERPVPDLELQHPSALDLTISDDKMTAKIVDALTRQLPRIIILELAVSKRYTSAMLGVLQSPLPILRHLEFFMPTYDEASVDAFLHPTLDLRPISSSTLTSLFLGNVRLHPGTSAPGIKTLQLWYDDPITEPMSLSADFPNINTLILEGSGFWHVKGLLAADFTALTLRHLTFLSGFDLWIVALQLDFTKVETITSYVVTDPFEDEFEELFAGFDGEVHLRVQGIEDEGEAEVSLTMPLTGFMRTVRVMPWRIPNALGYAIIQEPPLRATLSTIDVSHNVLLDMFSAGWMIDLAALRTIRVHMHDFQGEADFWPMDKELLVRCFALTRIVLTDLHRAACVSAEQLLAFVTCLDTQRTQHETIVLAGVRLVGCSDGLQALFREIVYQEPLAMPSWVTDPLLHL